MIHGLDTGFLVAVEVTEHAEHSAARQTLATLVGAGDRVATYHDKNRLLFHQLFAPGQGICGSPR